MKTKIVRIGNSQGIRIPKSLLVEAGLSSEVELTVTERGLMLEPLGAPRTGWAEAAESLAAEVEAKVVEYLPTEFDETDWEW